MIVVINPSSKAGHSFQGLHRYCSHDAGRAQTAERVDWMATHNLATDDPDKAWRIMAATAYAQNDLKRANGIRAGRAPKDGAVMHVVMSFDQDEPASREQMERAARDLLAELGADPAKMRGKSKPSRRQFADEHQAVMYAHSDTGHTHLHVMVNRIHPQTGVVLPTNNDHNKAQNWALKYSKEHGTDHKTPARAENDEMRRNGEYVKAEKRKTRNAYEQDQKSRAAANDNKRFKDQLDEQRKKDADLAKRGRDQKARHDQQFADLLDAHKKRRADLSDQLKASMNKARAEVREDYRPKMRELHSQLEAEKRTFEAMEQSFFGRAANAFKTVFAKAEDIGAHRHGFNVRRFNAAGNAGERKRIFEAAQERIRRALERERDAKLAEQQKALREAQKAEIAANRQRLIQERADLKVTQQKEAARLKAEWQERNREREALMREAPAPSRQEPSFKAKAAKAHARTAYRSEFDASRQAKTQEQDNKAQIKTGDQAKDAGSAQSDYARAARKAAKEAELDKDRGRSDQDDRGH
jgi:hypothetical protein